MSEALEREERWWTLLPNDLRTAIETVFARERAAGASPRAIVNAISSDVAVMSALRAAGRFPTTTASVWSDYLDAVEAQFVGSEPALDADESVVRYHVLRTLTFRWLRGYCADQPLAMRSLFSTTALIERLRSEPSGELFWLWSALGEPFEDPRVVN